MKVRAPFYFLIQPFSRRRRLEIYTWRCMKAFDCRMRSFLVGFDYYFDGSIDLPRPLPRQVKP